MRLNVPYRFIPPMVAGLAYYLSVKNIAPGSKTTI